MIVPASSAPPARLNGRQQRVSQTLQPLEVARLPRFGWDLITNDVNAFVTRTFEPNAFGGGAASRVGPVRLVRLSRMWIRHVAKQPRVGDENRFGDPTEECVLCALACFNRTVPP